MSKKSAPQIYLGVDWGKAKIGLAIGDDFTRVVVPFKVVKTPAELIKIIKEEKIDHVVVGQPVGMSGQRAHSAEPFEKFLVALQKAVKEPIELVDERLTSKMADRLRQQGGEGRGRKGMAEQDAVAAMLILEAYFSRNA